MGSQVPTHSGLWVPKKKRQTYVSVCVWASSVYRFWGPGLVLHWWQTRLIVHTTLVIPNATTSPQAIRLNPRTCILNMYTYLGKIEYLSAKLWGDYTIEFPLFKAYLSGWNPFSSDQLIKHGTKEIELSCYVFPVMPGYTRYTVYTTNPYLFWCHRMLSSPPPVERSQSPNRTHAQHSLCFYKKTPHRNRHLTKTIHNYIVGAYENPAEKISSSSWIISLQIGVKIKKVFDSTTKTNL